MNVVPNVNVSLGGWTLGVFVRRISTSDARKDGPENDDDADDAAVERERRLRVRMNILF